MKYFVITGHKASTSGDFKLDDISGGAGRLDIMCRCINSGFFLSHDLRKDVQVYLVLEGGNDAPKTVRFSGEDIRYLNPDERSTSSLIRNALLKKVSIDEEVKSSPGVYVSRMSFEKVINKLSEIGSFVYLKEDGEDCRAYEFPENPVFVLGDNRDLTDEEENILLEKNPEKISIGPRSLHADHCIIIVHNEMDRRCS
ncbi:MAG: tRNA (pseudouridine(54)-N(1))-methyltransferase TrmY [Candidatus Methanomethylophilaceae archaeon]|nr:tRNA (pseudouridine(54)-N(1))-methyltransferase TrmY [Candidatus Methanomethylophilaceae archaeon]MDD3378554.1 tRNA (pseudouridine(54)-N(1))-methyltransferase TrmY [Candidatus Methanomethylophilaceae archaeon]MDY0224469.1 tRNA (pseudouridine(54)-N(1))-methyltransferase TrmY [Candidatus Methanomethylophilaceae archaeon]